MISNYGDEYKFVIPLLGEFHLTMSFLRTIFKKYNGFCIENLATNCSIKGATLIKLIGVKDYRLFFI